jgi:DNA mismatch endonuclease, patch repair protein
MATKTDSLSKMQRSAVMRAVRSERNKSTELVLLQLLRKSRTYGWRRRSKLLGKPDFIFPKQKVVCFVDGCFWHGCSKHCRIPKVNRDYWSRKIMSNKARDLLVIRTLKMLGWRVVRIWEHALTQHPEKCLRRLKAALVKGENSTGLRRL